MEILRNLIQSLGLNLSVVLAQAIAFIVLLVVVRRYLFGPVADIMQQREEQIANNLAGAEAQHAQAQSLRKEYEANLARIADEARQRLEQAMQDAQAQRQQLLENTQGELQVLQQRHQAQMAREYDQLRRELRAEMSDIAVMAASTALRRRMTPELQSAVIDQVIHELEQQPPQRM